MPPKKEWRVVISLDDGTNTWVSCCPVGEIHRSSETPEPNVTAAAAQAFAYFIESVTRDEERIELKRRWDA